MVLNGKGYGDEWHEIVYELENDRVIKTGDANFWRPYVCQSSLGQEGGGEDVYIIFAIAKENAEVESHFQSLQVTGALVHFKIPGAYSSYRGTDWYSPYIVHPKIKTTVVFES